MSAPEIGTDPVPANPSRTWIALAVAALVALGVYAPTFVGAGHGFTNYDDPFLLSADNPAIARGFAGFVELLSPVRSPQFMNAWLPLYYGSLGLDHHLGGGAPWVFHLHSAMLHAACAAMVVLIARRLGMTTLAAAVAGVAFAVHPAATENVAWVASRKDLLSFLWMSFAALAYLVAIERSRPRLHLVGAACLVVSMLAKGTTLVLPLLLVVHATLVRRDGATRRERLLAVVPYAAVALVLTAVHLWIAGREGTAGGGTGAGLGWVLLANLEVVWRYTVLLVLPLKQSVEWGIDPRAVDGGNAVLGGAVLVAFAGVVAWTWRSRPLVAATLLCVALALAPFNNVFPRTSVLFAERYAYVALLPVALAIGALVQHVGVQGLVGAGTLIAGLCVLSVRRVPTWHDAVTLWEDAAATAPRSALVRMQLADACAAAGRAGGDAASRDAWTSKAESAWRDAMTLATDDLARMRAETGLGTHLLTTAPGGANAGGANTEARVRECVALLESAEARLAEIDAPGARTSQLATIRSNRAAAREALGDADRALADWQGAVQADDRSAAAWNGLARLCFAVGRARDASEALARSAALAPADAPAARERASLRLAAGDLVGAKGELEAALGQHPDEYGLLIDAGRLDASLQRPLDAERRFRKALAARPGDEVARQGIAAALLDQAQAQCARDDLESARSAASAAAEFAPNSSAPDQVLGIIARRAGDLEEASARFRRARDLFPEGVRIREALASVLLERSAAAYDAGDETAGSLLAEEAVAADAPSVATIALRLERGVAGWPPPSPDADERARVTRAAAVRGLAYLAMGRASDALPELLVAERGSDGGSPALRRNALRLLVRTRFLLGQFDAGVLAAEALAAAFEGDPKAWEGKADLASAYVERAIARRQAKDAAGAAEDFQRARATLDEGARLAMPEARYRLRRGEVDFADERYVEATREFDRASDADPADPEPYLDRAAVFRTHFLLEEDKSYLDGAERDLRRALSIAPSDPRAMAALGEVLTLSARPSEAYPWLQRALLADPSQTGARRLLAELAIRAGRSHLEKKELKEAREVADRAVALGAPAAGATIFLGDVLRAQGEWSLALAEYERARAAYPSDPEVEAALARYHFDLGHAYLLQNRRREAAEAFLRCRTYRQEKVDVASSQDRLHGIAVASFEEGVKFLGQEKAKEAAEAFATSVLAEPTSAGWFNAGLARSRTDDLAGAAEAYGQAIALAPDDVPSRINRAAVLLLLGAWDEAEADYRWVIERLSEGDPDRAGAERQLRWIAEQRKELEGPPK